MRASMRSSMSIRKLLKIAELVATITLDDTGRGALPPALQRLLERYAKPAAC
jgi:hypothetical protein